MTGAPWAAVRRWTPAALAVGLAGLGLGVNLWRPLAPAVPPVTTGLDDFAPAVLDAVRAYRSSQRVVAAVAVLIPPLVALGLLAAPVTRRWLVRTTQRTRAGLGAALGAGLLILATQLVQLPTAVWLGYVHERDWGLRTSGIGMWARDQAVELGLLAGGIALGAAVARWAVQRWPTTWHWWSVPVVSALAAVLVLLHPLVIRPLFLTTSPLGPGPVRDAVEEVLATAGLSDVPIEVGDASRRTTRVNAFVSGLGPSRELVLYDNLLELPPDEVAYVVAHELAHRRHRDLPRGVLLTAAAVLPVAVVTRWLLARPRIRGALGWTGPAPPALALVVVAVALVAQTVSLPIAGWFSRRAEAAADAEALVLSGAPAAQVAVARTFVVRDLADPDPPRWAHLGWGTHPTPGERIRSAVAYAQRHGQALPSLEQQRAAELERRHPATLTVPPGR